MRSNRKTVVGGCGLFLSALLGLIVGCPGAGNAPIANAGADQAVAGGSQVTLNGSASFDPGGSALSFAWTQTAGTTVTVNGANTANATFTAPNATETLTFALAVTNGSGATGADSVNVVVTAGSAPTSNAGTNQTVNGGDTVTLDGSASSDPNGDTLTFDWSQTAGTSVTLSDSDTDSPSFTAPNENTTLTFELTVSDGSESATDSVDVVVQSQTTPQLFIANFVGNTVTSYLNPSTVNGNIAPDTNLSGAQTQLTAPSDIAVTGDNTLIATNFNANSVTSYEDAPNTNGNLTPDGNVQGAATLLDEPTTLTIKTSDDLLFVANTGSDVINVYAGASTSGFNGNLAPTRTITSTDIDNPFGINFGGADDLYVANNGNATVSVFANASSINGTVSATRIINSPVFSGADLYDVFVDGNDVMFVVDANGFIYTFNNASGLNGAVNPDFTLTVQGAASNELTAIIVDSNGIGYIVDTSGSTGNGAIYSFDGIATLNGTLAPNRTIQGTETQLNNPIRVFLIE